MVNESLSAERMVADRTEKAWGHWLLIAVVLIPVDTYGSEHPVVHLLPKAVDKGKRVVLGYQSSYCQSVVYEELNCYKSLYAQLRRGVVVSSSGNLYSWSSEDRRHPIPRAQNHMNTQTQR